VRAVLCRAFGSLDDLEVAEVPSPVPGPGEVLLSVCAAGINYPDALKVLGRYQSKPPLPFTPGSEVAGIVKAIGAGSTEAARFAIGDAVYGTQLTGGFAEEIAIDASMLRAIPAGRTFEEAACVSTIYNTSYYALITLADIRPGDVVLVLGAAGGVGLAAIDIARAAGARVIAAASTAEKLAVCRQHGADELINYADDDLRARLKELNSGRGVDIVYDPVGGPYSEVALRQLAWGGRYLVVGFAAGEIPRVPLNIVLLKGGSVIGVFWGEAMKRDAPLAGKVIDGVAELFRSGRIHPPVSGRYRFPQVAEALTALLGRKAHGKLVLLP
jgi:NADPH:quinone reductase